LDFMGLWNSDFGALVMRPDMGRTAKPKTNWLSPGKIRYGVVDHGIDTGFGGCYPIRL